MPNKCCVKGCTVTRGHHFPQPETKKELFEQWIHAVRQEGVQNNKWKPKPYSIICRKHFQQDDYLCGPLANGGIVRQKNWLKPNAVPSVFSWTKPVSKQAKTRLERKERRDHKKITLSTEKPVQQNVLPYGTALCDPDLTPKVPEIKVFFIEETQRNGGGAHLLSLAALPSPHLTEQNCDSPSFVAECLPTFLQEHDYAQVTFIERSSGKRYHLRPILPTQCMLGKSVVTPHHHSEKEPLDRSKQKETEKNEGCQSSKTQSCPKSQKNGKRKLAKKANSKRIRTKQTENTCIDERSDAEQEFIIKIERDEDYEDSDINSYQVTETETALQTEPVLEKRVQIKPESIPDSSFETDSNSSHRYVSHPAGAVKLEQDSHNPSHGNSSHPTYAIKIEPDNNTSSHGYSLHPVCAIKLEPDCDNPSQCHIQAGTVKLKPYIDNSSYGHSLHLAGAADFQPDRDTAEQPGDTCLPAAATEVKTEPGSDTEETPLAFFETSSRAQNLVDSNMMSEAVRTIVKSEIVSDLDDSEHATTVYVCELCNECFYSHHQLLIHRRNHVQSSNIKCVGFKSV